MKRPIKPAVVVIAVTVAIIGLSEWFFGPGIAKWIHPAPPVEAQIAEPSYFDTLKAVDSDSKTAFLTDSRLIDTHTPYQATVRSRCKRYWTAAKSVVSVWG